VLFHLRGDNRFRRALEAIRAGRLGLPLGALATYLIDKPPSYYHGGYSNRAPSSWRLSPAQSGGGFLMMNVIHHFDAVRALLGTDADSVFAATAAGADAPDLDDVVSVVVRFGPVVATFAGAASAVRRSGEDLRIWGTVGNVDVLPEAVVTGRDGLPERLDRGTKTDPRTAVIADFAEAVLTGRPPAVPVEDALAVQAMVEAAYRSARTGVAESPPASTGFRT
jgi:predicted dehydrogenase